MSIDTDQKFYEYPILKIKKEKTGYEIHTDLGCLFVTEEIPFEPKPGMIMRMYGNGPYTMIRGLMIDGAPIYYRTAEQDQIRHQELMYGKDAADYLRKWDEEGRCWSVSMGGLGPGYEQCIQITMMEILRFMLEKKYDCSEWRKKSSKVWEKVREEISNGLMESLNELGLSGAQWGAALGLAARIYIDGPIETMKNAPDGRTIQVGREFPQLKKRENAA